MISKYREDAELILSFEDVQLFELFHINKRRSKMKHAISDGLDLSALCLSGGGIRSASFCLGVIRSLAKNGLLKQFDYLSTVSGGGFTGAFLSRWVHEKGYETVEYEIQRDQAFSDRASPLYKLREYISYLTPRFGLTSLDSLAGVGIYVRNLMLNWLVFVPFFISAIAIVQLIQSLFMLLTKTEHRLPEWMQELGETNILIGELFKIFQKQYQSFFIDESVLSPVLRGLIPMAGVMLLGTTFMESVKHRPGWWNASKSPKFPRLFLTFGLPIFLASFLFASSVASDRSQIDLTYWYLILFVGAAIMFLAFVNAMYTAPPIAGPLRHVTLNWRWKSGFALTFQGATMAFLLSIIGRTVLNSTRNFVDRTHLIVILSPIVFAVAIYFSEIVYVLLMTKSPHGDLEREWLARSTGAQFRLPLLWLLFALAALIGPELLRLDIVAYILGYDISKNNFPGIVTLTGIAGTITIWLGQARFTLAGMKGKTETIKEIGARWVLSISTPIFIFAATALLASFSTAIAVSVSSTIGQNWLGHVSKNISASQAIGYSIVVMIFAVICWLGDIFVDINKYSLHGTYRNRIIRTFLGASNDMREPGGFLDFDPNDNIELCKLVDCKNPNLIAPQVHIMNMAMNIPASPQLVLQERKALPFSASAIAVGSSSLRIEGIDLESGCYRSAIEYGKGTTKAITLGTAAAISGAAFNSNMGYHSSFSLNVLLTIFNVRLGAWLGNPGPSGKSTYRTDGPKFSLAPLAFEAFGLATENRPYVQLSDGGHFENLGLYEMIARKCALILVIDAGADPLRSFEDLGIAERLTFLDLGARLEFPENALTDIRMKTESIAIGNVSYDDGNAGTVIYIKPNLIGDEPVSVTAYAQNNKDFPHEPTVDQWFNESQFNAYLQLGEVSGDRAVKTLKEIWNH